MATNYPGSQQDFSDVIAAGTITASNHNTIQDTIEELETKLGLSLVDPSAPTIGHFKMTTQAGTPSGTPVNGVGSMVWNNSDNSLHVNTASDTWANITGGSAFTEAVTISAEDTDPLLIITQTAASATGSAPFLKFGDTSHTLEWKKSDNSFILSHSSNSASIKLQDNSTVVIGTYLSMGTATATGIGFGSHGGIYGTGGSRLHVYPTGSAPLIIGSNTTSQSGPAVFFEAIPVNFLVTTSIDVTENTDAALTITQSGTGNILKGIGVDADQGFLFDNTGGFQLNFSTSAGSNPAFDFGGSDNSPYMSVYGKNSTNGPALRYEIKVGQDAHSYTRLTGRNKNGASLFIGDDDGPAASYEYELGIRYVAPTGDTDLFLKGADEIWRTEYAAGGSFNLYRKLTMFTTAGLTAGTVAIHTASGTATGGTAITLIDTGGGWTDDEWINGGLQITRNTDSSVHYVVITDNTDTTLTFATPGFAIVSSDTYSIQAGGLTLTSNVNEVSTVAATTNLCVMPPAFAGERVTVINTSGTSMRLYPFLDDDLGAGVNTLTNLAAGVNITYIAYDATNWFVVT